MSMTTASMVAAARGRVEHLPVDTADLVARGHRITFVTW